MQFFSQIPKNSRDILLTTVYDHRNSRASSLQTPQFSFLVETLPSKPDEEEDISQHLFRLQKLNQAILSNMHQMDTKLKNELAKRGRLQFLKLNDNEFPYINESLHYKGQLNANTTQYSEVQKQASIFEIDQNNNYFKFHQNSVMRYAVSNSSAVTARQIKSKNKLNKVKPKSKPNTKIQPTLRPITHQLPLKGPREKRRVYQSVLSKFSTATLLKMSSEQA